MSSINSQTVGNTNIIYSGKVREVMDIGYGLLAMVGSDRLSAFDHPIMNLPNKGVLLNGMSSFWFNKTKNICPNHFIYARENVMIVKKCIPFKVEVIVRGYITGNTNTSLWTHYNRGERVYCGITFPDGLRKNQILSTPVVTPTTKSVQDMPISPQEIVETGLMTQKQWDYVSAKALQLFKAGQEYAREKGFILVDTKYEFGVDCSDNKNNNLSYNTGNNDNVNKILLIDELHTCDSSRYWRLSSYQERFDNGEEPESLDKDAIRKYISTLPEFEQIKAGELSGEEIAKLVPNEIVNRALSAYTEMFKVFNVNGNFAKSKSYENQINEIIDYYFRCIHSKLVIIIMGSVSDEPFSKDIQKHLTNLGFYSKMYITSAHKEPKKVLEILDFYNNRQNNRKVVFITVAGRSNALSGFVGANSRFPCIACPPFKDQLDMSINIHSTLQMPSNVPVMTVLDPKNASLSASRILDLV